MVQKSTAVWQFTPEYALGQVQLYVVLMLLHVPPFWHRLVPQYVSTLQLGPVYPLFAQLHEYEPTVLVQTPP